MTATAELQEAIDLTVPAHAFALGWLNAFTAASDDPERQALYRTLSLEVFDEGVQMIATSGTVLFRTWVSGTEAPWPDPDLAPLRSIIVRDADQFGKAFMRTLLRVTADEAHEAEEVTLTTQLADEGATLALGTEFMRERLVVRVMGQRLDLPLHEERYPNWRGLDLGVDRRERVAGMTFATRILGLMAKLKGVSAADLEFSGHDRTIAFVARGAIEVRGLLAPMRRSEQAAEAEQAQ